MRVGWSTGAGPIRVGGTIYRSKRRKSDPSAGMIILTLVMIACWLVAAAAVLPVAGIAWAAGKRDFARSAVRLLRVTR